MSGAYVAKPAAVVTPEYPPGWNPDWPWPGFLPPGFVWDYVDTSVYPFEPQEEPGGAGIVAYPWELETYEDGRETTNQGKYNNVLYICLRSEPDSSYVDVPVYTTTEYTESKVRGGSPGVTLRFTQSNWGRPQRVYLQGVNDEVVDGDFLDNRVVIGPAVSGDADYNGLVGPEVYVTNYEEIDTLDVLAPDIVYTPSEFNSDAEDYAVVTLRVYKVDPSVDTLEAVVSSGTIIAERSAQFFRGGSIQYSGDSSPYGAVPMAIRATGLDLLHKYVVVTTIDILNFFIVDEGPLVTDIPPDIQISNLRIIFKYGSTTIEDYMSSESVSSDESADTYFQWAVLDNTQSDPAAKLVKTEF